MAASCNAADLETARCYFRARISFIESVEMSISQSSIISRGAVRTSSVNCAHVSGGHIITSAVCGGIGLNPSLYSSDWHCIAAMCPVAIVNARGFVAAYPACSGLTLSRKIGNGR